MTSGTVDSNVLGAQRPRIDWHPPYASTSGQEAIELAQLAGLTLDPWQKYVLGHSLGEQANGQWAAFEVGLCVARQNGKSELLVARMLAGLFILGEELQIFSAHQFDSAVEIFRRLVAVIEYTPELATQVKLNRGKIGMYSHGNEGIELKNGQRVRFKARSSGGGRGFTCDCLYLDEAMILKESMIGNVLPTLSAVPNAQVWYAGSAVDQAIHEDGIVFTRLRERGLDQDPSVAWFEWSVDRDEYQANPSLGKDPHAWAQANPGMGIRISSQHVSNERRSMAEQTFMTERLGIGDWPRTDGFANRPIGPEAWSACVDGESEVGRPVVLAFDVSPDRAYASISACGRRSDGIPLVDVTNHSRGTYWVPERLRELCARYEVRTVIFDSYGPAGSLVPDLAGLNVELVPIGARDLAHACGVLFDSVMERTMRHGGTPELMAAMDGAVTRPLSDSWAWSRSKSSGVDISPLVACTMALWGQKTQITSAPQVWDLNQFADRMNITEPKPEPIPYGGGFFVPLSAR